MLRAPLFLAAVSLLVGCGRVGFTAVLDGSASDAGGAFDAGLSPDAAAADGALTDGPPGADAGDADDAGDAGPACVGDFLVDSSDDDLSMSQDCRGAGCSLRSAVAQANLRSGASSTICLADALSILLSTEISVSKDVTISGRRTPVCGLGSDRLFVVVGGGALRLRDLTVCHGRVVDEAGAAVWVQDGTLDTDGVVFDDNVVMTTTTYQEGGAVRTEASGRLALRRTRFTNNRVDTTSGYARGGAIAANAGLSIDECAFVNNHATDVGGALFIASPGVDVAIARSLFASNGAARGGAIDINCAATGTIAVENSTFAGNASTDGVTGIIFVCGSQTLHLAYCTFLGSGSALVTLVAAGSAVEWLADAIDAGSNPLCTGIGTGSSLGFNVASADDAICALSATGDRVVAPGLAPLADNGGATETAALSMSSAAIDAVAAGASCPATDQRGAARPVRARCDSGAFEAP